MDVGEPILLPSCFSKFSRSTLSPPPPPSPTPVSSPESFLADWQKVSYTYILYIFLLHNRFGRANVLEKLLDTQKWIVILNICMAFFFYLDVFSIWMLYVISPAESIVYDKSAVCPIRSSRTQWHWVRELNDIEFVKSGLEMTSQLYV